jgi:hypothetical protein
MPLKLTVDESLEIYEQSQDSNYDEVRQADHQYPHQVHSALKTKLMSIPHRKQMHVQYQGKSARIQYMLEK